ncbi:hypothetical protein [Dechloromonas sp. A34]|uniref:hypothetical protein n=1 Tax=Dechloromonas sp. A34 TaxID=447588 RepID=UPI002248FD4E|nr:hypothetical protein [Dechloromonas sp. A34]
MLRSKDYSCTGQGDQPVEEANSPPGFAGGSVKLTATLVSGRHHCPGRWRGHRQAKLAATCRVLAAGDLARRLLDSGRERPAQGTPEIHPPRTFVAPPPATCRRMTGPLAQALPFWLTGDALFARQAGLRAPQSTTSRSYNIMTELNRKLTIAALTLGLAFSINVVAAEGLSSDSYKAGRDKIAADYKSASAPCKTMSGNAKDVCMAEAKGQEKVAKAELKATYKPTAKSRYEVSIAKAEAEYEVAKEKCDDQAGAAKDSCVKEAKSARAAAKADAKAAKK